MATKPLRLLVLSSTRKERDGIAEYTRQVFKPEFQAAHQVAVTVADITAGSMFCAPFQKADLIHIQHEFFMFDRLVGVSALAYYPWLWIWSWLFGYRIVTTIHSTYNVDELESALPHFAKYKWLFPFGKLYLRFHLWLVGKLSRRIIILSKIGVENIRRVYSASGMENKVRYIHLGNYASNIQMRSHGLLRENRAPLTPSLSPSDGERVAKVRVGDLPTAQVLPDDFIFTLFGFAFPTKGYEYAIQAMDILVNQHGRKDFKLVVVSGETGKGSFPGGGQGGTYIGWLKQLTTERKLEPHVIFTGYLPNDEPLLEEIFNETFCFLFPYLNRNFPSGAISTVVATRKPLLVSDIQSFQEYEGLARFREKDANSLAQAMAALSDDPERARELAEVTRVNAEKFDMRNIFERHAEIYREALGRT